MLNNASGKSRKARWLVGGLVVVLLLLGAGKLFASDHFMNRKASSEYQAVFLTNGQVYFGKLDLSRHWLVLRDIYYLQVNEGLQQAGSGNQDTEVTGSGTPADQRIQLVKLGSELHGPEDEMFIPKDKVLFWENMKEDSRVLQSIRSSR